MYASSSANREASPAGAKRPSSPSTSCSTSRSVATTGRPLAIASITALPSPSQSEGNTQHVVFGIEPFGVVHRLDDANAVAQATVDDQLLEGRSERSPARDREGRLDPTPTELGDCVHGRGVVLLGFQPPHGEHPQDRTTGRRLHAEPLGVDAPLDHADLGGRDTERALGRVRDGVGDRDEAHREPTGDPVDRARRCGCPRVPRRDRAAGPGRRASG